MKITLLFLFLPFVSFAQFGVFAGGMDSQIKDEQSIITYNFGAEYSFTNESGFSISPRFSFSERGGKVEGVEFKTRVFSLAYVLKQDFKLDKNTNAVLFPLIGFSFDKIELQGKRLQSSVTIPVGMGVKFGNVRAWFEYQINLTGDYTATGLNLGYWF